MITWFRYVPHSSIQEYLSKGWEIADDLRTTHHGSHAVLCVWKGDGEPK